MTKKKAKTKKYKCDKDSMHDVEVAIDKAREFLFDDKKGRFGVQIYRCSNTRLKKYHVAITGRWDTTLCPNE